MDAFSSGLAKLRVRTLARKALNDIPDFISIEEAAIWCRQWCMTFPATYDLIVGIPRSGLMIASMIATRLGKPLATPEMASNGQYWQPSSLSERPIHNALLVDDATETASSLLVAQAKINTTNPDLKITTASLIVTPESMEKVDLYFHVQKQPTIYEWNLMHLRYNLRIAFDMDGVLCEDYHGNGKEEDYITWLERARPYLLPNYEISCIITARSEKYRVQTENWLKKHEVRYRKLVMMDVLDLASTRGKHEEHKIRAILNERPDLFIESDRAIAKAINYELGIPVIAIDEMSIYNGRS
jgi:orotate phosphoribosyltransferase